MRQCDQRHVIGSGAEIPSCGDRQTDCLARAFSAFPLGLRGDGREDEHDGREPECEDEGAQRDDEE